MDAIKPAIGQCSRRTFLKLSALLPFASFDSLSSREYHFQYEGIIGTSLDLVIWSRFQRTADLACQKVLEEIDRLAAILDTRNPNSEISLFAKSSGSRNPSRELQEVFDAYSLWESRTGGVLSIRPGGPDTPLNVDALGKAYIIDRGVVAARKSSPAVEAVLLDIGGDIAVWGRSCDVEIADPDAPYDNAPSIAAIAVRNQAVATSGVYARGAHLMDARTGRAPKMTAAATVVASDAVTANALATTLCSTQSNAGLQLVESTEGAEALRIESGLLRRTSGFANLERSLSRPMKVPADWPSGYQLKVSLPLTSGRGKKRPYVAVWVEDSSGKVVRLLAFWGSDSKYQSDLSTIWNRFKGSRQLRSVSRATRPAGRYELVWDGLDDQQKPMPPGAYRLTVETNQEHGVYAKQSGVITLGDEPASITLPATANFDAVLVQYGPK